MPNSHRHHRRDTSDPATEPAPPIARREVIYYFRPATPLSAVAALPYTDVIVAFLIPTSTTDLTLRLAENNDLATLKADVHTLRKEGKQVLISLGGYTFSHAAYPKYALDVNALAAQIVGWVTKYGFNGVDIDFEHSEAFTNPTAVGYDGTTFLIDLTCALATQLPANQNIITHAPQSPYWDPNWDKAVAPYRQIWSAVGDHITWVNNQFYNNKNYDDTTGHQRQWYTTIAGIIGASRLVFGSNLAGGTKPGHWTASQLVAEIIQPLRHDFPEFGGVMGWELYYDTDGTWGQAVAQALT